MQQNQQGRRFADSTQQQPVYRFPQNQPIQQWQAQQSYSGDSGFETPYLSQQDKQELKRTHRKQRRRHVFSLWNLFAVIGIITVLFQTIRYVIIPFLVYLNVLSGGVL